MPPIHLKVDTAMGRERVAVQEEIRMDEVKAAFDAGASEYDARRRWIIPEIEEFYGAAVWAAAWPGGP